MISVILPTYNEGQNIATMIQRIRNSVTLPCEIIVVDDNSNDGTGKEVEKLQANDPHLRLIVRKNERGLTTATQRGIEESQGDYIVWMDSDLSQPPEKINELLSKLIDENYDIAVASRYVKGGGDARRQGNDLLVSFQVFLSLTLRYITSLILGVKFRDWSSGFIAVRKNVIDTLLPLEGDYGEYFMNMIYKAHLLNFKVIEVPYILTPRTYGTSKTATNFYGMVWRGLGYFQMIFRCLTLRKRIR